MTLLKNVVSMLLATMLVASVGQADDYESEEGATSYAEPAVKKPAPASKKKSLAKPGPKKKHHSKKKAVKKAAKPKAKPKAKPQHDEGMDEF